MPPFRTRSASGLQARSAAARRPKMRQFRHLIVAFVDLK